MVDVEIDRRAMFDLWELRDKLHAAQRELETTGPTATVRMLAFVVNEYGEAWEDNAPFLTGTLASSTREIVIFNTGRVFIDPANVNPILGGKPVDYGPKVHQRKPWVSDVFYSETKRIVTKGQNMLFESMDEIFAQ